MNMTFEELVNSVKQNRVNKATREVTKMGQELNRDLVAEVKRVMTFDKLNQSHADYIRDLNKQRIKALGLSLIQGGKA